MNLSATQARLEQNVLGPSERLIDCLIGLLFDSKIINNYAPPYQAAAGACWGCSLVFGTCGT